MVCKVIFDVVRRLLGRGLRQVEVDAIDAALHSAGESGGSVPLDRTAPVPARTVGAAGIALIKRFEGCERRIAGGLIEAYPDPGTGRAPWTIGWGATGPGIGPGTVWTQAQADARLESDLARYAADVALAIGGAPTTQAQFDALVSFHYNTGAIARATLTRKHIAGDYAGAAAEFARWNRAGGRVLKGLVRRRREEAALYGRASAEPRASSAGAPRTEPPAPAGRGEPPNRLAVVAPSPVARLDLTRRD
jgi:GH24 family phage-related lysozyme (muramidase)